MHYYHNICYLCSQAHTQRERKNYLFFSRWHMLFNTFSSARKQTSSFGKNQHDGYFFLFCKDLCRGQGHGRRSCASGNFCQKPRSGQSQILKQVHAETAICTEPGFPKEQVSSSCSLTSPIPRLILKSDSSFLSLLHPPLLSEYP